MPPEKADEDVISVTLTVCTIGKTIASLSSLQPKNNYTMV